MKMKTLLLFVCITVVASAAFSAPLKLKADKDTQFLVEAQIGEVVDASGRIDSSAIQANGVEFEEDADFGEVMSFTGSKTGVLVPDLGKISFKNGITLEAWIKLTDKPNENFPFVVKNGMGSNWDLQTFETFIAKGGKFSVGCFSTLGEKIDFTEEELKHHWGFKPVQWYGSRHDGTNGNTPLPIGEWVHVAWTYDKSRQMVRTWVNGSIDREFFQTSLSPDMTDEDNVPVRICPNVKGGIKVAQVRLSSCTRNLGETAPVRVFIQENAYRPQGTIHLKPIRDDLPVPVEVEVMNIHIPFGANVTNAVLNSVTEPITVDIPKGQFDNCRSDLVIKLRKDGRELWRQESVIGNPRPGSAEMAEFYKGNTPYPKETTPIDWKINLDNTFTYKKKPVFPLMLYFARPKDFDLVTDLGFNMIGFRADSGKKGYEMRPIYEALLPKAIEKGITIDLGADRGLEGQGFHCAFDEPYGYTFEVFRERYLNIRAAREHTASLPVYSSQNNNTRYRETAQICDVLGPDPYNKGRSPFRNIYDSIATAVKDTDGLKPIMCVIGNYGTDLYRPKPEDLRTMCYLAIEAGSTALGFYSWDEGEEPGGPMDTACKPEQIEAYRKLFAEFKTLNAALTTANVADAVSIEPAQPRGFFPCVKKGRDGKTYLIVSSDLYRSTTKKVVMPSAAGKTATLLFGPWREGMKLSASDKLVFDANGTADLSLPPVSSAVYVLK